MENFWQFGTVRQFVHYMFVDIYEIYLSNTLFDIELNDIQMSLWRDANTCVLRCAVFEHLNILQSYQVFYSLKFFLLTKSWIRLMILYPLFKNISRSWTVIIQYWLDSCHFATCFGHHWNLFINFFFFLPAALTSMLFLVIFHLKTTLTRTRIVVILSCLNLTLCNNWRYHEYNTWEL